MNVLLSVSNELRTEQQCLELAERLRWSGDIRCIECGSARISKFLVKRTARKLRRKKEGAALTPAPLRHLYQCAGCGHQFTATSGTMLHDTHLPLVKWFLAIALMVNADGAISARQMQRDLRVSYQTAWYLCHRIREALQVE